MLDVLSHLFAAVCGQNPGHTWAPGGSLLPCCQRCTGLYVGAGVAGLLHLWLRPRLSGRFLEIHGLFLLLMAPFGFHWLAQGPVLRTITGVLFGFAVVTFLWLPLESRAAVPPAHRYAVLTLLRRPLWRDHARDARGASGTPALPWPQSAAGCYFLSLGVTLVFLPLAASVGGSFAGYALSALMAWGALALIALVAADVILGLLAVLRWLRRLASSRAPA